MQAGFYSDVVECLLPMRSIAGSFLGHVTIKAGFYTAAQVLIYLDSVTLSPTKLVFVPGVLGWLGTNYKRRRKNLRIWHGWGLNTRPSAQTSNTLPRRYKRLYRRTVQVCYMLIPCDMRMIIKRSNSVWASNTANTFEKWVPGDLHWMKSPI